MGLVLAIQLLINLFDQFVVAVADMILRFSFLIFVEMAGFEPASSPAPKAGGVTGLPNISLFAVPMGIEPTTVLNPRSDNPLHQPLCAGTNFFLRNVRDSNP